jgi:hypothetical protein
LLVLPGVRGGLPDERDHSQNAVSNSVTHGHPR